MTTAAPLLNRNLLIWLIGSAQSQLGSALASIALSFLVLHQTGSAGQMALTLACGVGPNLLMPLAGALVDRLPLKVPLIGADVLRGLLQLTVALLALRLGEVPLWLVNGAALIGGLAGIFAGPASGAAFPQLVPEAQLARANGLNGSVSQGAWLLGMLGGGVLVARVGPPVAILLDGLSFLIMAALLTLVRLPHRPPATGPRGSVLADVQSGLQLMRRSKVLSLVPVIGFVVNAAIAPVTVITPKLMETLGPGAGGYGLFLAIEGAGAVLGGLLITALGARLPVKRTTAAGMVLLALAYLLMAAWPVYVGLLGAALLVGLAMALVNTPLSTLMQQMVPPSYLGRVFSVLGTVATLGMPLTLLLVAPLVDRFPVSRFFTVAGLLVLAGGAAWVLVALAERTPPDLSVPETPDDRQPPTAPAL
ncbi:MFS transporter [Deinococcus sonorensis]|uniref:MFS transporter n=2 Tax=Deinococcus sonorensis TaxID=309891 RepID=A0AAU7UBP3_9DEIO